MKVVSTNYMPLVRINAQEWYHRADWMLWLNSRTPMNHPATWHMEGDLPGDYSDVFFTYAQGDGSDYGEGKPSIPSDIWKQICDVMKEEEIEEALVWVANM